MTDKRYNLIHYLINCMKKYWNDIILPNISLFKSYGYAIKYFWINNFIYNIISLKIPYSTKTVLSHFKL